MGCAASRRKLSRKQQVLQAHDFGADTKDVSPLHQASSTLENDETPIHSTKLQDICARSSVLSCVVSFLQPNDVRQLRQVVSWSKEIQYSASALPATVTIWVSPHLHHFDLLPLSYHASIHIPRPVSWLLRSFVFFKNLTSLTIGCYGLSLDITMDDDDVENLLRNIGYQLRIIGLIKLHNVTLSSLQNIFTHCSNITQVTFFGCETARHEEYTSLATIASSLTDIKLALLDIRYSIELTDVILNDIITSISSINIFLGSRMNQQMNYNRCTQQNSHVMHSTAVSLYGWQRFTTAFCSSELLYIDDLHAGFVYCPRYLPQPGQEALTLRRNMSITPSQNDLTLLTTIVSTLPIDFMSHFASGSSSAPIE